ncbi:hypothetical protein [Polaribacter porphyrae]|uniref:Secretion system C-terminal sorting domain-containing protein n=1 Tax=Polaribacter porphyrae TaxID=1137780 RepID=A0A2S7WR46_9FLAO|nr:hypothetical protein [Polaribacter porphyrae]PQJ80088.1 hypothetical protein BTO18_13295 [Polaribacter porphyrae]
MKTMKRKILIVVFMLTAMFNYANRLNETLSNLNIEKVRVEFKNVKKGDFLTIKNEDGITLHSETISKEGVINKVFDFSNLTEGNYVFELEKDFEIKIKSFKVEDGKVIFNKDSEQVIFKPVVRSKSELLLISKISFDKKPLQIVLFFEGEKIYSETAKSTTILNRVYKLDADKKGNYKVIIYNNGRSYTKRFKI